MIYNLGWPHPDDKNNEEFHQHETMVNVIFRCFYYISSVAEVLLLWERDSSALTGYCDTISKSIQHHNQLWTVHKCLSNHGNCVKYSSILLDCYTKSQQYAIKQWTYFKTSVWLTVLKRCVYYHRRLPNTKINRFNVSLYMYFLMIIIKNLASKL